ncbi:MAG TPA: hypothetical protein VL574_12160 [Stellaceae bacterium]|jgi:hypothetical protein|nr:hypothetical protein [Stellaceae bacterium]
MRRLLSGIACALFATGAADAATVTKQATLDGEDVVVTCDTAPFAKDYVATTDSGVKLTAPYAKARGADIGLVVVVTRHEKRMMRYAVAHRRIRAIVRVKYDHAIPDWLDLVFTSRHAILVRTSIANAGIFTISDVYELPRKADGRIDDKTIAKNEDVLPLFRLGLGFYDLRRGDCSP